VSSFVAFSVGAFVPLLPWFFTEGTAATVVSLVVALVAAAAVGVTLAVFTQRSKIRTAARQAGIAAVAAGLTWVIGNIAGTAVT
jgi:VIT1/CCC1 family predicted Fe2+/Mn2+ transporter